MGQPAAIMPPPVNSDSRLYQATTPCFDVSSYIVDTNNWYLTSRPTSTGVMEIGFLSGRNFREEERRANNMPTTISISTDIPRINGDVITLEDGTSYQEVELPRWGPWIAERVCSLNNSIEHYWPRRTSSGAIPDYISSDLHNHIRAYISSYGFPFYIMRSTKGCLCGMVGVGNEHPTWGRHRGSDKLRPHMEAIQNTITWSGHLNQDALLWYHRFDAEYKERGDARSKSPNLERYRGGDISDADLAKMLDFDWVARECQKLCKSFVERV